MWTQNYQSEQDCVHIEMTTILHVHHQSGLSHVSVPVGVPVRVSETDHMHVGSSNSGLVDRGSTPGHDSTYLPSVSRHHCNHVTEKLHSLTHKTHESL